MVYLVINAMLLLRLLVFTPVVAEVLGHSLPSRFPPCKKADLNTKRCPVENIAAALQLLRDGIEELGVPSIDPMELSTIEMPENGGPVSLGLKFTNITVTGLASVIYTVAKFDFKDEANMSIIFTGTGDALQLESDYEMSGRMLILPISGKGHCKIIAGSSTLQLINDNWKQVWEEMKPTFIEIFSSIYKQIAKRVFDRVPFEEIFPN